MLLQSSGKRRLRIRPCLRATFQRLAPSSTLMGMLLLACSIVPFLVSHHHDQANKVLTMTQTQKRHFRSLPIEGEGSSSFQRRRRRHDGEEPRRQVDVAAEPMPSSKESASSSTTPNRNNNTSRGERQEATTTNDDDNDKARFHFVVSSDCSPYQRWQVLTQIHSAVSVGQFDPQQQNGNGAGARYTWILSGCPAEGEEGGNHAEAKQRKDHGQDGTVLSRSSIRADIQEHFASLCSGKGAAAAADACPSVHFSPDFSNMTVYGGEYADGKKKRQYTNKKNGKVVRSSYGNTYRFNNKPNGLRHWALSSSSSSSFDIHANEAIVLIDPDFIFLRTFDLQQQPHHVTVSPGKPAAASYRLGDQWLDFNRTQICGPESKCVQTTRQEVYKYFSAGPPYIIHASDVPALATKWCELVPPTYDEYPLLYAEMFAYSMAAAHLDLRHALLDDLFTGCMIKWPRTGGVDMKTLSQASLNFIDTFDDINAPSSSSSLSAVVMENIVQSSEGTSSCFRLGSSNNSSGLVIHITPPPLLHYCQRYPFRLNNGKWKVLAKRRVLHNVLECHHNETLLPWDEDGKKPAAAAGFERSRDEYWHALAVCAVIRGVAYAKRVRCRNS